MVLRLEGPFATTLAVDGVDLRDVRAGDLAEFLLFFVVLKLEEAGFALGVFAGSDLLCDLTFIVSPLFVFLE